MSQGKPAQTTQVSQVQLPKWVEQASQENYELAKSVADRPFEQYQGQRVAGESPLTQQGYKYITDNLGAIDPYYGQATDALGKATGILDETRPLYSKASSMADAAAGVTGEAGDIYRSTSGPLDIQPYLNPYTNEVERNAINNAERSLTSGLMNITDRQRKAKAFGGSRAAIESGVAQAEGSRGIGDLSAQLRKAGIDFATGTALQDRTGRQAAAAGLLGAGQNYLNAGSGYLGTASGMRDTAGGMTNAASGYLNTAANRGQNLTRELQALLGGGIQQQGQQQRLLDSEMAKWGEARQNPIENLNIRLAALGMSPYGKTEIGNKSATSERLPTDYAALGLGALSLFMSDRNAKTDIKKVGDDPLAGIPIYSYRYKGDPKTYPKMVGPMAQDIEKKFPSAVKKVGRYKTVDLNNLMEVLK